MLLLWLINPIAADIFLIHYQYGQHRVDYNARNPFLTNMLPCRNDRPTQGRAYSTFVLLLIRTRQLVSELK